MLFNSMQRVFNSMLFNLVTAAGLLPSLVSHCKTLPQWIWLKTTIFSLSSDFTPNITQQQTDRLQAILACLWTLSVETLGVTSLVLVGLLFGMLHSDGFSSKLALRVPIFLPTLEIIHRLSAGWFTKRSAQLPANKVNGRTQYGCEHARRRRFLACIDRSGRKDKGICHGAMPEVARKEQDAVRS